MEQLNKWRSLDGKYVGYLKIRIDVQDFDWLFHIYHLMFFLKNTKCRCK